MEAGKSFIKSESDGYCPPLYEVPKDSEGFIQSFSLEEVDKFKEFFQKFGFVVVRDILAPEECEATISEIWSILEQRCGVKRDDPKTHVNSYWSGSGLWNEGILPFDPVFTKQAILNRQNYRFYQVWSALLGRKDLLVNHDRYGLFRAVRKKPENIKEDWQTMYNVHLDMNPWSYFEDETADQCKKLLDSLRYKMLQHFIIENNQVGNAKENQLHLQGLINLADNREEDGGFQLVPGFHHHLKEFVDATAGTLKKRFNSRNTFIVLPDDLSLHKRAIRITMRAGSCCIWDQRVAHGSRPNNSDKERYAQFFKMFPASPMDPERSKARAASIKQKLEAANLMSEITEHGLKVPWDDK